MRVETAKAASENPVFLIKCAMKALLSLVIFLRWLIRLFAGGGGASEASEMETRGTSLRARNERDRGADSRTRRTGEEAKVSPR